MSGLAAGACRTHLAAPIFLVNTLGGWTAPLILGADKEEVWSSYEQKVKDLERDALCNRFFAQPDAK